MGKSGPKYYRCSASNCSSIHKVGSEDGTQLFRFPKDLQRCRVWVKNCGNKDILKIPATKLCEGHYVCSSHFAEDQFWNKFKKSLIKTAIPTLFTSDSLTDEEIMSFSVNENSVVQGMAKYYAVVRGRVPGIYTDWNMCKTQVEKIPNAKFKKFATKEEAADFIKMHSDPTFQTTQTRSTVTSLPLPLSPTKNKSNPTVHTNQNTLPLPRSSLLKNLPLPLSPTKNGSVVKGLNFEVPRQDETVVTQTKTAPLHMPANASLDAEDEVIFIPTSSDAEVRHVNDATEPQTTTPTQPSVLKTGDLEERFEEFEKVYREFHKQMLSELRNTKKMIKSFKKKTLVQMQLKVSVAGSLTLLEDRLKSVMLGFSSQLSFLQQQVTSGNKNTAATSSLDGSVLNHASQNLVKGARMHTMKQARSKKESRKKLSAMMQPMTPAQVRLMNKRSYSTDGNSEDGPANKVAKSEICHNLVPPVKVEQVDSGDEADYGGSHGFNVDSEGYVQVYTDGACDKNGWVQAKAGIGVWFGQNHPLNSSEPVRGRATNNTAEIQAAQYAIELARGAGIRKLCINTDSEFLINSITKWIHKWKKNKWQLSTGGPVKNKENFEALDIALRGMDVKWNHVRGHAGILGNEMADSLARAGASRYKKS